MGGTCGLRPDGEYRSETDPPLATVVVAGFHLASYSHLGRASCGQLRHLYTNFMRLCIFVCISGGAKDLCVAVLADVSDVKAFGSIQ